MQVAAANDGVAPFDEELRWIEAARRGDAEAFRQIVEIYQDRLFTFLLRMVRQWEEAEELAQDAFVRAWQNLDRYDGRWPFRTWLFTIARNLALNALRRPRAEVVSIVEPRTGGDLDWPIAAVALSPVEQAIASEQQWLFERALKKLSPRAATIFTLFYQEGMRIAEIAEVMGVRAGTIKVALHRLRETLKQQLVAAFEESKSQTRAPR